MLTPPLRTRLRAYPRGPLRLFPPRTDPDPPGEAGCLRGGLRISGHPVTVHWWRRRPPAEVDDAVRLDSDIWIALRVD